MGKLRNYKVSRSADLTGASFPRATTAPRSSRRGLALSLVAIVGVAAGGVLGAGLYHFDKIAPPDIFSDKRSVPPAFAAAVAQVFDTSANPVDDGAGEPATDKIGETVDTESKQGLSWKPGSKKDTELPNVVVVSSVTPAAKDSRRESRVASLLPVAPAIRQSSDVPQALAPVESSRYADNEPRQVFAKEPRAGDAVRQEIATDMEKTGSVVRNYDNVDVAETEAEVIAMENKMAALGTAHFVAPTTPVASVAEAVAEQNGYRSAALKYVNLRARPNNDGEVLAIVPAKADVLVEEDCGRWCRILFEGKRGYIHRTFIRDTKRPEVTVDVAETEAEVIAMENKMAAQGSDQFVTGQSTAAFAAQSAAEHGYRKGCATKYVNMRAGPDKEAEVLTIIPADAEFMAEANCTHWCSVVYQGQKGYIYKTYLTYAKPGES
ncbi:SH3 domain-containing protein [Hoeflea sp. TYP-13]|uniref:SH3 domain-containing protein n=1 Tax=Hoeflea sp. TYP-13 TaxID=3230023 RepID=UPI0034C5C157